MITEIVCLDKDNDYAIWERMDKRHKCIWDYEKDGISFFGTEEDLFQYLKRRKQIVRGVLRGGEIRNGMV